MPPVEFKERFCRGIEGAGSSKEIEFTRVRRGQKGLSRQALGISKESIADITALQDTSGKSEAPQPPAQSLACPGLVAWVRPQGKTW